MAPKIDDKWLWLGFGVFFFFAANGLRYAIQDVIELTRIHPSHFESETKRPGEQPEDTISLEHLRILAESPQYNISNAAISMIVTRFENLPNGTELLTKDLNSKDESVRKRADSAVRFLKSCGVHVKAVPRSPPGLPDSPRDHSPAGIRLTTAELARRLSESPGGVMGGDGWTGPTLIPSSHDPVAGWTNVPRERPIDGDAEELERRRRRREAMVLHEGAGAVREDDIFRPRG